MARIAGGCIFFKVSIAVERRTAELTTRTARLLQVDAISAPRVTSIKRACR
jgi:hypothetical protein